MFSWHDLQKSIARNTIFPDGDSKSLWLSFTKDLPFAMIDELGKVLDQLQQSNKCIYPNDSFQTSPGPRSSGLVQLFPDGSRHKWGNYSVPYVPPSISSYALTRVRKNNSIQSERTIRE